MKKRIIKATLSINALNDCNYKINKDVFIQSLNLSDNNLVKNKWLYTAYYNLLNNKFVKGNKQLTEKELTSSVFKLLTESEKAIYIYCHHFNGCSRAMLLNYIQKDTLRRSLDQLTKKGLVSLVNDKYIANPLTYKKETNKVGDKQFYIYTPFFYNIDTGDKVDYIQYKKSEKYKDWAIKYNLKNTLLLYGIDIDTIKVKEVKKVEPYQTAIDASPVKDNIIDINQYRYTGNQGYTTFRITNMIYTNDTLYFDMYNSFIDKMLDFNGEPYKQRKIQDPTVIDRITNIIKITCGVGFTNIQDVVDYANNNHINITYRSKDDNTYYISSKKPNNYKHVVNIKEVEEKANEKQKEIEEHNKIIDWLDSVGSKHSFKRR